MESLTLFDIESFEYGFVFKDLAWVIIVVPLWMSLMLVGRVLA